MLSVSRIETATLASWPALETVGDGQWRARFAAGFSGRSNSIWSLDPADDENAEARLAALVPAYEARGLPPLFRVTPLTGRKTFAMLETGGWQAAKTSLVLATEIGETGGIDATARLYDATDPAFLAIQARLQGFEGASLETFTAIVASIKVPACGIVIAAGDDSPAAALICAQTDGIAMLYDVITAPAQRGRGFGRRMIATALSWAAENGARHAALQVQADNIAALGLYLAMGFTFRYPYHYRRRPETAS